jgi:hypothetical protein
MCAYPDKENSHSGENFFDDHRDDWHILGEGTRGAWYIMEHRV